MALLALLLRNLLFKRYSYPILSQLVAFSQKASAPLLLPAKVAAIAIPSAGSHLLSAARQMDAEL